MARKNQTPEQRRAQRFIARGFTAKSKIEEKSIPRKAKNRRNRITSDDSSASSEYSGGAFRVSREDAGLLEPDPETEEAQTEEHVELDLIQPSPEVEIKTIPAPEVPPAGGEDKWAEEWETTPFQVFNLPDAAYSWDDWLSLEAFRRVISKEKDRLQRMLAKEISHLHAGYGSRSATGTTEYLKSFLDDLKEQLQFRIDVRPQGHIPLPREGDTTVFEEDRERYRHPATSAVSKQAATRAREELFTTMRRVTAELINANLEGPVRTRMMEAYASALQRNFPKQ